MPSPPSCLPPASLLQVKGILNKLTPEKFERLLSQLIPLVNSYDVLQARAGGHRGAAAGLSLVVKLLRCAGSWPVLLGTAVRGRTSACLPGSSCRPPCLPPHRTTQGTIHQVFENAVQQPTFVAMYADLCRELDAALPEFHAPGAYCGLVPGLARCCGCLRWCSLQRQAEAVASVCSDTHAARLPGAVSCPPSSPAPSGSHPSNPPPAPPLQARTAPLASRRCWPTRARRSTRPPRRRAR